MTYIGALGDSAVLASNCPSRYHLNMATIAEIEKLAFDLPDSDRAVLAAHLLRSLPPVLDDEDGGIDEALRRDAELSSNPQTGISLDQFDQAVRDRRR